jgi:hypothetical protein
MLTIAASERGQKTTIPGTIQLVHWPSDILARLGHWGRILVASEFVLDLTGHLAV